MKQAEDTKPNGRSRWTPKPAAAFGIAAVLTIGLCAFWAWLLITQPCWFKVMTSGKAAEFGDSFGGISALFTALAFAGVIWTALLQRQELELQRNELADTRKVLDKQSAALAQQAFDSIFFEMLRSFREVASNVKLYVDYTIGPQQFEGERAIRELQTQLLQNIADSYAQWMLHDDDSTARAGIVHVYRSVVYTPTNDLYLGPYFRSLYHVFKLIDGQIDLTDDQKVSYANIARANLPGEALLLVAANVCTDLGKEFLPLVENYGVLKHMGHTEIRPLFARFIKPIAFMGYDERKAVAAQAV